MVYYQDHKSLMTRLEYVYMGWQNNVFHIFNAALLLIPLIA